MLTHYPKLVKERLNPVTVCARDKVRNPGYYFAEDDFANETFAFEELFHERTVEMVARGELRVKETRSEVRNELESRYSLGLSKCQVAVEVELRST